VSQTSGRGSAGVEVGNKTECALLSFVVLSLHVNYQDIRTANPESTFRKLYTFNSERKYMATVVPLSSPDVTSTDHAYRLYAKGAADVVLNRSALLYPYVG